MIYLFFLILNTLHTIYFDQEFLCFEIVAVLLRLGNLFSHHGYFLIQSRFKLEALYLHEILVASDFLVFIKCESKMVYIIKLHNNNKLV